MWTDIGDLKNNRLGAKNEKVEANQNWKFSSNVRRYRW